MINLLGKASDKSFSQKKTLCSEHIQVNTNKYIYTPQYFISVERFLCRMYCPLDKRFAIYSTYVIRQYFHETFTNSLKVFIDLPRLVPSFVCTST